MPEIRDARPEEAGLLCQAEREIVQTQTGLLVSLPHELRPNAFEARIMLLANGSGKYLVLLKKEAIVGHASLSPMALAAVSHVLRLDMCIHVGHWRKGYGRALLDALIRWAGHHPSAHKIELLARATNHAAIALYASFGFVEEGRHIDRVRLADGRFVDDIAMALRLRKPYSAVLNST